MWVESVVVLVFTPRGFSLGTPVLPSSQKATFLRDSAIITWSRGGGGLENG